MNIYALAEVERVPIANSIRNIVSSTLAVFKSCKTSEAELLLNRCGFIDFWDFLLIPKGTQISEHCRVQLQSCWLLVAICDIHLPAHPIFDRIACFEQVLESPCLGPLGVISCYSKILWGFRVLPAAPEYVPDR